MTPVFDTHCHYNLDPLWPEWRRHLQKARKAGVTGALVASTDIETSRRALELRAQEPEYLRAAIGLHPELVAPELAASGGQPELIAYWLDSHLATLERLARDSDFDAWGEIGLDFYQQEHTGPGFALLRRWQSELLRRQLALAAQTPKPICLHVRDDPEHNNDPEGAYWTLQRLLDETGAGAATLIFHCFSGPPEYLEACLARPHAYISFAGNLTFKRARGLRSLAERVPTERLLLETDAPFLAPEPHRGQPCQPAYLADTAAYAQQQLNVSLETIHETSLAIFG